MSGSDFSRELLQALNDENLETVDEYVKDKSVKQWIDNRVDHKQIQNARVTFADFVKDITCLAYASRCNNFHAVRKLVQAGADVTVTDSQGYTPLHWACYGKTEVKQKVEYLLSCDASLIRARDNDNDTPLHILQINSSIIRLTL